LPGKFRRLPGWQCPTTTRDCRLEIVLDIVSYFSRPVVSKIIYVILVVVPLLTVKPVPYVFVLPKIIDVAPVFAAVVPEINDLAFIVTRPLIPILLAICDRLISLR
jgi:hypothetical protein